MRILLIFLFIAMISYADASPESDFWGWFISNNEQLKAVKIANSPIMRELSKRLKYVHQNLVYEMSLHDAELREIIISGDGLKEMIPIVQKLTQSAPKIDGWKVIAFRPRMEDYIDFDLDYAGEEIDPKKIWFHPITDERHFDIILYHPGYTEKQRNKFIAGTYILLDMALGEFDVMTKIRYIDHKLLPEAPKKEGLLPFAQLREMFDEFYKNKPEPGG